MRSLSFDSRELRWRCERLAELLSTESRLDAIALVGLEACKTPWQDDTRPAPAPMPMGYCMAPTDGKQPKASARARGR